MVDHCSLPAHDLGLAHDNLGGWGWQILNEFLNPLGDAEIRDVQLREVRFVSVSSGMVVRTSTVYSTFDRVVKVLASGASLFGGVGSIPTECISATFRHGD